MKFQIDPLRAETQIFQKIEHANFRSYQSLIEMLHPIEQLHPLGMILKYAEKNRVLSPEK